MQNQSNLKARKQQEKEYILLKKTADIKTVRVELQKKKQRQPWPVVSGWEHHPVTKKDVSSIPRQDTQLGCGVDPRSGHVCMEGN